MELDIFIRPTVQSVVCSYDDLTFIRLLRQLFLLGPKRRQNNGDLGTLNYMEIVLKSVNGQLVEYKNVVLTIGANSYNLGNSVPKSYQVWYTYALICRRLHITGELMLTGDSNHKRAG